MRNCCCMALLFPGSPWLVGEVDFCRQGALNERWRGTVSIRHWLDHTKAIARCLSKPKAIHTSCCSSMISINDRVIAPSCKITKGIWTWQTSSSCSLRMNPWLRPISLQLTGGEIRFPSHHDSTSASGGFEHISVRLLWKSDYAAVIFALCVCVCARVENHMTILLLVSPTLYFCWWLFMTDAIITLIWACQDTRVWRLVSFSPMKNKWQRKDQLTETIEDVLTIFAANLGICTFGFLAFALLAIHLMITL